MTNAANSALNRLVNATCFSLAGLRAAWTNEAAFRQECVLTILLAPVGLWLGRTPVERSLLIGSCLFVLIVELLNSAIEATIDRVGTDRHELAARAKDLGSAAVLVSLVLTVVIWIVIGYARLT